MRTIADTRACPTGWTTSTSSRRSLREIQLYTERTPTAVIIPGHDMQRWEELEAVYT